MGTRSLIHIKDGDINSETLVTIYKQFDGYPDALGLNLFFMLQQATIVNGYGFDQQIPYFFNGMGCLAAYVVTALKGKDPSSIGGVYIYPPDSSACGEEWVYTIHFDDGMLALDVFDVYDGVRKTFYPKPDNLNAYKDFYGIE